MQVLDVVISMVLGVTSYNHTYRHQVRASSKYFINEWCVMYDIMYSWGTLFQHTSTEMSYMKNRLLCI